MNANHKSLPCMRSQGPWRPTRRAPRKRRGAVSTEYAGILAFIVATGVAAHLLVGMRADRLFDRTARQIGHATGAPVSEPSPDRDKAVRPPSEPTTFEPAVGGRLAQSLEWLALWTALAAGILAIGVAMRLLWRRVHGRSRPTPETREAAPSASSDLLERLFVKRQQIRRLLLRSLGANAPFEAQVHQLMSTDIACVHAKTPFADVARTMAERQIRHMLVCRKDGSLLGIISDRDIRHRRGDSAEDVMTPDPIAVSPQSPVGPAVTQMISVGISCLPVLTPGGKVCGILTTTDLLLSLQCSLQVFEGIAAGFRQPTPDPPMQNTVPEPLHELVGTP